MESKTARAALNLGKAAGPVGMAPPCNIGGLFGAQGLPLPVLTLYKAPLSIEMMVSHGLREPTQQALAFGRSWSLDNGCP